MKSKTKKQVDVEIKVNLLLQVFKLITIMAEDVKLCFSSDGFRVKIIDSANIGMLELCVKPKAFEKYNTDQIDFAIHVESIMNILKLASPQDTIKMDFDNKEDYISIRLNNLKRRARILDTRSIPDLKMPSLNLSSQVVLPVKEFYRGIKAAQMITDSITMKIDTNKMELAATENIDQVKLAIPKEDLNEHSTDGADHSSFSIEYLEKIINLLGKQQLIRIHIGTNAPLHLEFGIADGNGHVNFILAPRVEQNE